MTSSSIKKEYEIQRFTGFTAWPLYNTPVSVSLLTATYYPNIPSADLFQENPYLHMDFILEMQTLAKLPL